MSNAYTFFVPLPTTLEELKRVYHALAFKHHPDRGGDTATMQAINAEYDRLFGVVGSTHRNAEGQTYTKATTETPEDFKAVIEALVGLPGLIIEIIGRFVWVTGNTRQHKDTLKALDFRFNGKKSAWYLAPEGWHRRTRKQFDLDEIRDMFGCERIEPRQGKLTVA